MSPMPTDPERVRVLVERVQARIDYERSCEELYRLYYARVRGFFRIRRFSADECAELTQETFIRVFIGIEGLQNASRFGKWLFEIAAHISCNELRRRYAAKRDAFEESIETLVASQAEGRPDALLALSSKAPGPLDDALCRERLDALRAELGQLPPQMRRCVILRVYHDLKYREIAVVMRVSIETVKAHLHQAKQRLTVSFSERRHGEEAQGAL